MGQCIARPKTASTNNVVKVDKKLNDEKPPSETGGDINVVEDVTGEIQKRKKLFRNEGKTFEIHPFKKANLEESDVSKLKVGGDSNVAESEKKRTLKKKTFWQRLFHRRAETKSSEKTEENLRPETEDQEKQCVNASEGSQQVNRSESKDKSKQKAKTQTRKPVKENTNKPSTKQFIAKIDCIESNYIVGKKLGEGGFGTVYEGQRLSDGLTVALKYISKRKVLNSVMPVSGYKYVIPPEVAIMAQLQQGPRVPEIIQLYEWYEDPLQYILVLERPIGFMDLYSFALKDHSFVSEEIARFVMRQVVQAACVCKKRRVFHRDITPKNVLVHTQTMEVKLIDFGASVKFKSTAYNRFVGKEQYAPPELYIKGKYYAEPATVWALGMMLFRMGCGCYPNIVDLHRIYAKRWQDLNVSMQLNHLIRSCLEFKAKKRPRLENILDHVWFTA